MKCPTCGSPDNHVAWTRERDGSVVRARDCEKCGGRFQTSEVHSQVLEHAKNIAEAFAVMKSAIPGEG